MSKLGFVILSLVLLSVHASVNATDKNKKSTVVVSQFAEFSDLKEHLPEIQTWSELLRYLDNNPAPSLEQTDQVFVAFQKALPALTPEQFAEMHLRWALNARAQMDLTKSQQQLNLVVVDLLSPPQQLAFHKLHGFLLQQKKRLFESSKAYQQAYRLALDLNQAHTANDLSMSLVKLFLALDKKQLAQPWLDKVLSGHNNGSESKLNGIEKNIQLAKIQLLMQQYEAAESRLLQVLSQIESQGLASLKPSIEFQLVDVYVQWQKLDLAQDKLEQLFVSAQASRNKSAQMRAMVALMELAMQGGSPWQANKILIQADKLQAYIYDDQLKQRLLRIKSKVLAARGFYQDALTTLTQYQAGVTSSLSKSEQLDVLTDHILWLAKVGRTDELRQVFRQYQKVSDAQANMTLISRLSFEQQSHSQAVHLLQQQLAESELEQHQERAQSQSKSDRITALYVVILLLIVAAAMSLYWLYRKFAYEKDVDSLVDPVSLAYNHRFLSRQFRFLKYKQHKIGLVLFELDNMVELNQQFGHEVTDVLIEKLVTRLKQRLIRNTWLVRLKGGQFAVLANNFDHKQAFILAEILRKELNGNAFKINRNKVKLAASFAAIECPEAMDLEQAKSTLKQDSSSETARRKPYLSLSPA